MGGEGAIAPLFPRIDATVYMQPLLARAGEKHVETLRANSSCILRSSPEHTYDDADDDVQNELFT